jgi:phthiocerol/phenolphthiocerol synthesis type-I polyketide synthase D
MDKKQPCYGILDKGIFDPSKKLRTVEQMAEHYVKMITKLQPEGPYMLVGYCFAGFIAFEIAKRLKETGRKVALLGLIETPVVNVPLKVVPYHLNRALNIIRFLPIKIKEMLNRQSRFIDPYEIDEGFIFDVWEGVTGDNKWLDNIRKTHKINMQSTDKYMFTPYDGDIVLYTASKRKMWRSRGKDLGWASLTRKVDIVEVDSLHKDISMPPYIETIADDIKERISDITEGKQH